MAVKLKPDAILFDLDGVLIDSLDAWWQGFNDALRQFNHRELTRNEFIETYWGCDLRVNLKRLGLQPELADICNKSYIKHINLIKIYKETHPTLQQLGRYKKALITNTPRECLKETLKKFNLTHYFSAIIASDDVALAKPNPEVVFKACSNLNVKPEDTILIGDTESDVLAGKAAGCIVIGVKIKADYTIFGISELLKYIKL